MKTAPSDHTRAPSGSHRTWLALLAIVVLVALPVRLAVIARAAMISRDGATFIWYAQNLADDPVAEMRSQDQHPLFPAMILAAHRLLPGLPDDPVLSWQAAGMIVTLIGGLLAVAAMYALGTVVFNRRIGLIAAAMAALAAELCQLSADVLSDMPHLAVFGFALAAGIHGLRSMGRAGGKTAAPERAMASPPADMRADASTARRTPELWLLGAGVLSGAAYLLRPEGAEVAVVIACAALLLGPKRSIRRRLTGALVVVIGAGAVATPYMAVTGKLVQKKSIERFLPIGSPEASSRGHNLPQDTAVDIRFALTPYDDGAGSRSQPRGPSPRTFRQTGTARHRAGTRCSERPPDAWSPVSRLGAVPAALSCDVLGSSARSAPAGSREVCLPQLATPAAIDDMPRAAGLIAEKWVRALRVTLLLPVVVWLIRRREVPADPVGGRCVAAVLLLHLLILFLLVIRFNYWDLLSMRHVLILVAVTLTFSAAGVDALIRAVPAPRRLLAAAALAVVLVGPTLPWLLEARYADRLYLRRAGEFIRAEEPTGARVLTTRHRIAYYAHGVHVRAPEEPDAAWILDEARRNGARWLAFDEQRRLRDAETFFDDLERAVRNGESLERFEIASPGRRGRTGRVIVYRFNPGS